MKHLRYTILLSFFVGCLWLSGCASDKKTEPPAPQTLSKANLQFVEICEKDFNYKVYPRQFDNTLWLYFPIKDHIIDYKSSPDGPITENKATEKLAILFRQTQYENGKFNVVFDIQNTKKYRIDPGYQTTYGTEYTQMLRNIYSAISRSYFAIEPNPDDEDEYIERVLGDIDFENAVKNRKHKKLVHSHIKTKRVPDFFIIVIADITKGIATKSIFFYPDFRRTMSNPPSMPYEEYTKRRIFTAFGLEGLIDDQYGKSLEMKDITWPEFLSRQIDNRIDFKFNSSDFPPGSDADKIAEVSQLAAITLNAYKFETYHSVIIKDLNLEKERIFDKTQIKALKKED